MLCMYVCPVCKLSNSTVSKPGKKISNTNNVFEKHANLTNRWFLLIQNNTIQNRFLKSKLIGQYDKQ